MANVTNNPLADFIAADRADQENPLRDALKYIQDSLQGLQDKSVSLDQLPVADLQRQLSVTWHPEWTSDDTDDSILGSLFGGRRNATGGITTATFSNSTESAVASITHGLGDVPLAIFIQPIMAGLDRVVPFLGSVGGDTVTYVARSMTGSFLTGDYSFRWGAMG